MTIALNHFLLGANMMGYIVAGFFFFRFWKKTHDRLFVIFALAFGVLALNQVAFIFSGDSNRPGDYVYLVRLVAFSLILGAIIDKNRRKD